MRNLSFIFFAGIWLWPGCDTGNKTPQVSHLKAIVEVQRFDQAFFGMDTMRLDAELNRLAHQFPSFLPQFLATVLGIPPGNPEAPEAIRSFLRSYRPVYNQAAMVWKQHGTAMQEGLRRSLQLCQYYLPDFRPDSPFVITTFVGPMDVYEPFSIGDYGDVRTANGVGVALQLHLGADNSLYEEGIQSGIFYDYQVRRFVPETMLVNAVKNIIEDMYPYEATGRPLVEEMVEKGKRLYLLAKVLPHAADTLRIGYTARQLAGCFQHEALIWQFFVKNDLLYSLEPSLNNQWLKDGPKTPELGEEAPGYIGLFVGQRIVESFMKNNPQVSLDSLMRIPANSLFQSSRYKP